MGLNLNYIPLNYLETYFVDKDTGLPLSGGLVYFYNDNQRNQLQTVYKISGTPPNYTYDPLPNPCVLSAAGCFQDAVGNDIVPYAQAFDTNGNLQLYYIKVYANDGNGGPGVFQWDRQGVPNEGAKEETTQQYKNYITNGQFKTHWDLPNSGAITLDQTIVSPGLWVYERSTGSAAADFVSFTRYGSYVSSPGSHPRYSCRVKCTSNHPGDAFKKLSYSFRDVNKFASEDGKMTFYFEAKTNNAAPLPVTFKITKFYGIGGSPTEEITIKQFALTPSWVKYSVSFSFGTNVGKNIGNADDDAVALSLSFPADAIFDADFTNFVLVDDVVALTSFPIMLDEEFFEGSAFNFTAINPAHDKSKLHLPVVCGVNGWEYSDADVGKIFECMYEAGGATILKSPKPGEYLCNGASLETDKTDPYGCPNSRLQKILFSYDTNMPRFGTGLEYHYARQPDLNDSVTHIVATNNTALNATAPTDGTIPTGFTFGEISPGSASYGFSAILDSNGLVYIKQNQLGASNGSAGNGTSGFTITTYAPVIPDINVSYALDVPSVVGLAGTYLEISSHNTDYYMWFTIDGSGVDPALPGKTPIKVALLSSYSLAEGQQMITDAFNGYTMYGITPVAASTMTAGCWYDWYSGTSQHIYVWYQIAGLGSDPALSSAFGIKVALSGTETAAEVAYATMFAINNATYALPDTRGLHMRSWSADLPPPLSAYIYRDPDAKERSAFFRGLAGNKVGSSQTSQGIAHVHTNLFDTSGGIAGGTAKTPNPGTFAINTESTGGLQANVNNMYVMHVIKY
jgi:hypothetical protein